MSTPLFSWAPGVDSGRPALAASWGPVHDQAYFSPFWLRHGNQLRTDTASLRPSQILHLPVHLKPEPCKTCFVPGPHGVAFCGSSPVPSEFASG